MAKHKKVENGQAPTPEEEPTKPDFSQIESDLGTIHAARGQAQAKRDAPLNEVKDRLRSALDSKREMVAKFIENWAKAPGEAEQVLKAMELPEFRVPEDAVQRARNGVLSAARELISAVEGTTNQIMYIEGMIAGLHDLRLQPDHEKYIMGCINGLDGLEKHAEERFAAMKFHLARLKKYAPKVEETVEIQRPEDLDRDPRPKKAITEFDVFNY